MAKTINVATFYISSLIDQGSNCKLERHEAACDAMGCKMPFLGRSVV
jgi:hypothetical protein